MEYASLLGLIVLLTPSQAVQMCTSVIQQEKFLPENQILKLTRPGILSCFVTCMVRHTCMSFNFNTETGECQLNGKVRDRASTQMTRHEHFDFSDISHCKVAGCLRRPDNPNNGKLHETHISEESPRGTVISYTCDPGYMSQEKVVCQDNGTWSSPVCVSVSSCSMVKQYQSDSEDGEYWLRLTNFDNYTTKIYCHDMSTFLPQEYLSLPNTNYGIYPPIQDYECDGITAALEGACAGRGGEMWFNKIKVDITAMKVALHDTAFASISGNIVSIGLGYGMAFDCYTHHNNNNMRCGIKGKFKIDLRRTGWRVSEDQQWEIVNDWKALMYIDRQMRGAVITLHCGGYPGGCIPTGGLFLKPDEDELNAGK